MVTGDGEAVSVTPAAPDPVAVLLPEAAAGSQLLHPVPAALGEAALVETSSSPIILLLLVESSRLPVEVLQQQEEQW